MSICPCCGSDIDDELTLTPEEVLEVERLHKQIVSAKVKQEWRELTRSKPNPEFDKKLTERLSR